MVVVAEHRDRDESPDDRRRVSTPTKQIDATDHSSRC